MSIQHLEIFGKGYVIEHCIALFKKQQKEKLYQMYITDALKAICDNTARMYGGATLKRYMDLLPDEPRAKKEETRTAQEIISGIQNKLNQRG